MIWYVFNIMFITMAWFLPLFNMRARIDSGNKVGNIEDNRRKAVCIIGTVCWIVLSGLRHVSIGDDTITYKAAFERVAGLSFGSVFDDLIKKYFYGFKIKDPGYSLFVKIFQLFSTNYQVFLIFIAILFFVGMGIFIYRYSINPYVSFVLFSTLFYSFFAITGLRQTIATAFVVWIGIELIKRRKLIPFIILVALASTIHNSVWCFLPFYWISKIKINKISLTVYWVLIVLSFIFREQLFNFLKVIVEYETYGQTEGARGGLFIILLLAVFVIATLFYKSFQEKQITNISINAIFCACFFSSFLLINENAMRVVQYYSLFLLVLLPAIGEVFKEGLERGVYVAVIVITLLILLFRGNPTYMFFWQ